jgi:hypothetical protein
MRTPIILNKFRMFILLSSFTLLINCKDSLIEFKYSKKENLFECESANMDLIKEALYAFENYIIKNYDIDPPNTLFKAYAFYFEVESRNKMPALDLIDDHLIKVIEALKKEKKLWVSTNAGTTLNYNHPIMKCIQKGIKDPTINETFEALIKTNSFRSDIFLLLIEKRVKILIDDKSLAAYYALDHFYSNVINVNFKNIEQKTELDKPNNVED